MSDHAKDLITKLLVKNPENRITLEDALNHEWFKVELTEEPIVDKEVIMRMVEFNKQSLLIQKMKTSMANLMGAKHINSSMLNEKFKAIDTENNGLIISTDLIRVLTENSVAEDDSLILAIKENYNPDDQIMYTDFLAAQMDPTVVEKEWLLFTAFSFFDRENTGALNAAVIQQAFKTMGITVTETELKPMIKDATGKDDKDATINFEEFKNMMKGKQ